MHASGGRGDRSRSRGPSAATFLVLGLILGVIIGAAGAFIALRVVAPLPAPGQAQFTVELLPNMAYFERVSELIKRAEKSVYVVMFVMKYDPKETPERDPANALIELLVDARNRGLDVRVVVDDTTRQSYPETIEYLKSKGVPVRLDPKAGVTTHAKIVVVDGRCSVIGSHNWTESALSSNNEFSVLLCSKDFAGEVEGYFMELWEQGRPA
ncbi:MAG: phospholipase D-like domain-containing protein [Thermofilaceae archaeon]